MWFRFASVEAVIWLQALSSIRLASAVRVVFNVEGSSQKPSFAGAAPNPKMLGSVKPEIMALILYRLRIILDVGQGEDSCT